MNMKFKCLLILLTISLLYYSCYESGVSNSPDSKFSASWESPSSDEIVSFGQILIKNNIEGCGEYQVKRKIDSKGEFLLACTSDGSTWSYYLVYQFTGKVIGPLNEPFTAPNNSKK